MTDLREAIQREIEALYVAPKHAAEATDAIMALVQPVVTDKPRVVIRGLRATPTEEQRQAFWEDPAGKGLYQIGDTVLAWVNEGDLYHPAALPNAVTRDDVIEELADLAESEALSILDHDESVADWLRSRKGGA